MIVIDQFLAAQQAFGARVQAVRDDQWSLGTPCTEWDVAALVDHLIDEHRWAAPLLHGLSLEDAGTVVAGTRDEGSRAGNWTTAAASSADAFSAEGALERTLQTSMGPITGTEYLRQMTFDLVVHSWDLGRAIGFEGTADIPDGAIDTGLAMAKDWGDLSSSGVFGPAVDAPEDASPLEELLARSGRDPRG